MGKPSATIARMPLERIRFRTVVLTAWVLLAIAAVVYTRIKSIPASIAAPVAAAFLLEFPFYLFPAFAGMRAGLSRRPRTVQAGVMVFASILPWIVLSVGTGTATLANAGLLLSVVAGVSFWYIVLPASAVTDVGFLAIVTALIAGKFFDTVYLSPIPKVSLSILGHVMLIRTGALAILQFRAGPTPEYRFLPTRGEWLNGAKYFVYSLPLIVGAYWALGLVELRQQPYNLLQALGTFFGILWVVALSEEFFFRGLLQQWLETWTSRPAAAIVVASIAFGLVHLDMHHQFPNWRFATVAAIAGFFYGLSWRTARSVQSSMVTHALIVTLWKSFLR